MDRRTFILGGLAAMGALIGGGTLFVNTPQFGHVPTGERLRRMMKSPHYIV